MLNTFKSDILNKIKNLLLSVQVMFYVLTQNNNFSFIKEGNCKENILLMSN